MYSCRVSVNSRTLFIMHFDSFQNKQKGPSLTRYYLSFRTITFLRSIHVKCSFCSCQLTEKYIKIARCVWFVWARNNNTFISIGNPSAVAAGHNGESIRWEMHVKFSELESRSEHRTEYVAFGMCCQVKFIRNKKTVSHSFFFLTHTHIAHWILFVPVDCVLYSCGFLNTKQFVQFLCVIYFRKLLVWFVFSFSSTAFSAVHFFNLQINSSITCEICYKFSNSVRFSCCCFVFSFFFCILYLHKWCGSIWWINQCSNGGHYSVLSIQYFAF